jgi:MoaA/NifB/PqqE/SkfB family radical SAM enzyme
MDAAKAKLSVDPRRYFEGVRTDSDRPAHDPVCLYLETTNRCNLLCTTCPRTYEELEPPADMSWQLFCSIVDQIPNLSRAVLHGVGEPMLVKNLPRMVRYLKDRGTYVLFNTNGTVLNEKNGRALIEAGLDELRSHSTPPTPNPTKPFAARIISIVSFEMYAPFVTCRNVKAVRGRACRPA